MKNTTRLIALIILLITVAVLALPGQTQAQDEYERVLVQFKSKGASLNAGSPARAIPNAQVHREFNQLNVASLSVPASQVEALRNDPNVVAVQPDAPRYLHDETVPYGVEHVGARALWDADLDGQVDPGAPDGSGVLVCMIDSGVNTAHEDFAGVDFIGGFPADSWNQDGCGHGTHVAGTIAAQSNGFGVVGVSPGAVSIYVVRIYNDTCGWAYVSDLIDALVKCWEQDADIINMSLGGPLGGSVEEGVFDTLYNDFGILNVASAGNDGTTEYIYPAAYPSVISVAAVDQNNNVAGFSQKNDQVELAAPGVSILSTSNTGGYIYKNGTSMAAPHVTASAALLWSSDPSLTNAEIRQSFQESALDLGESGPDDAYGSGVIRSEAAYRLLGDEPTAVQIAGFGATGDQDGILVEWETASEIDVIGFNIHRADMEDGPETLLTDKLIPSDAMGGPIGAEYTFTDDNVVAGTTYYYWLEAVGTDGGSTLHGPASAATQAKTTYRVLLPIVNR